MVFPDLDVGPVLWVAAIGSLALGATGMLAARRMAALAAHAVILSVGVLLVAVAPFTRDALAAAVFYLAHGTFATAALFLVGLRISAVRGETGDALVAGPACRGQLALPTAYLLVAVAAAGLPPLGGFLAKLAILDAAVGTDGSACTFAAVLVASLFALVALARAGSTVFWKVGQERGEVAEVPRWRPLAGAGLGLLVAAIVALALLAGAAFEHADRVAGQLLDREGYIQAVLGEREGGGG